MQQTQRSVPECLNTAKLRMSSHPVMHHVFLTTFENAYLGRHQLERFAVQWYKTARAHKEAFPALIYNTRDDDVRFELIDILREEYGNGDRQKIHARLLMRFLHALGLCEQDVDRAETLPAVRAFSEEVRRIWRDGDPVYAFGLHFALEFLASSLHVHFANALEKYEFLRDADREYFEYHREAEQRHADFSEFGFQRYAEKPENRTLLQEGVDKGVELLESLWDEFHRHVFPSATPMIVS